MSFGEVTCRETREHNDLFHSSFSVRANFVQNNGLKFFKLFAFVEQNIAEFVIRRVGIVVVPLLLVEFCYCKLPCDDP